MSLEVKKLREKDIDELQKLLKKTREQLKDSTVKVLHGKSKNTSEQKYIRRDIARIMTVLNDKNNVESSGKGNK